MDKSGSGRVTYPEYWGWVRKQLKDAKMEDDEIMRVENYWNEKFFEISQNKWYFDWKDVKEMIKK